MRPDFEKLSSEDIYNLITEHVEIAAIRAADLAAEKVQNIVGCSNDCLVKSTEVYWWLGFGKFFKKHVPYTYLGIGIAAYVALFISFYLLFNS